VNGVTQKWLHLTLAFALGAGGAVAGTFTVFETRDNHREDILRIERQRQADRDELLDTLRRIEEKVDALSHPHADVPAVPPPHSGYGRPPLPQIGASP